ncbi:MAG: YciI family protein, partial [Alphaproteobacteria bacterium]
MLYAIHCTDRNDAGSLRMDTRPVHIDYLNTQSEKLVLGGATMSDDGQTMTGS